MTPEPRLVVTQLPAVTHPHWVKPICGTVGTWARGVPSIPVPMSPVEGGKKSGSAVGNGDGCAAGSVGSGITGILGTSKGWLTWAAGTNLYPPLNLFRIWPGKSMKNELKTKLLGQTYRKMFWMWLCHCWWWCCRPARQTSEILRRSLLWLGQDCCENKYLRPFVVFMCDVIIVLGEPWLRS